MFVATRSPTVLQLLNANNPRRPTTLTKYRFTQSTSALAPQMRG
jgi:hypothetical protein